MTPPLRLDADEPFVDPPEPRRASFSPAAAGRLIDVARVLAGGEGADTISLLMAATALWLLENQATPQAAAEAALQAGPVLEELVGLLADARLRHTAAGGTA